MKNKLKIIPLGGLNEIGKNMTIFEIDNEIIIVDCGLSFPDENMYGVDKVIPDFSYLRDNKKKVKALFITHGHEDHIGAVTDFVSEFNVDIYSLKFSIELIKVKLKEKNLEAKLHTIKPHENIKTKYFNVEFIRVCHSIPDSAALRINTEFGDIIHTGDFKIDYAPIDNNNIELNYFSKLGSKGVMLLLADSTNSNNKGFTMSESTVGETFDELFNTYSNHRLIIASFASNVHRIQQIVNSSIKYHRKVVFTGRSMEVVSKVAMELNYLKIPSDIIINVNDINKYPDNEIVIVTTGSQGETMAGLSRLANMEHRKIELKEQDVVIISASPIPGNEKSIKRVIDNLLRRNAIVIYEDLYDVHVSGHAREEELKLIHTLLKPKYFCPVHGEYTHLQKHSEIAQNLGMSKSNIFIMDNGRGIEISDDKIKYLEPLPYNKVLIDGKGDLHDIVLRDRQTLSRDGLISVSLAVDLSKKKIVSEAEIITRGFIYAKESEEFINEIINKVNDNISKYLIIEKYDKNKAITIIKDTIKTDVYNKTNRRPMVLVTIMEV